VARSYYEILGIDKDASDAQIKNAYRRKAKAFHPDTNKEDDAETKFKEVGEAYKVLKDPHTRAQYDHFGTAKPNQGGRRPEQSYQDINLDDLMRRFRDINSGNPAYETEGGVTIQQVMLPVVDMIKGGQVRFQYTHQAASRGFLSLQQRVASIKLEPNTKYGTEVELPEIPNMKFVLIPGNTARCVVQGIDILVPFEVSALDAAVGNKSILTHPSGKTYKVEVPAGTKNGTAMRLTGKGIPHVNGATGSLIGVVDIVIPALSEEQKTALKKLLKEA